MTELKRYVSVYSASQEHEMLEHDTGSWVRIEDCNALNVENERLRGIITRQRRELKRLNKYLGPYWAGFRVGLKNEGECRLRGIMTAAFGHERVRAAEVAAVDASVATKR